jgi:tetratricopeptide (TPR) repeat protein
LAGLYEAMGDYAKAEPFFRRALEIRNTVLGPEHPDTAASLNNLAALYWAMAVYDQALPFYQRALKIREKALGPEHPRTAISLNNLALLYQAMGAYDRPCPVPAGLKIREKALGPEHRPRTSLNNLGDFICPGRLECRRKLSQTRWIQRRDGGVGWPGTLC